ncbi:MAG: arginine--tRNA ligase [Clostridiales bacterium]|nr:arginine--tRNA ligase [Clostridiales bacterium]
MLTFKKNISEILAHTIADQFGSAILTAGEICSMLEYPPDSAMGDLALPCFKLSKVLKAAPPKIAQSLSGAFSGHEDLCSAEVQGGYLNIRISPVYLTQSVLAKIEKDGEMFGSSSEGEGKTVVLDYASPNIAKPFHIGHLGTTVIGHSLKLLHQFAGYKCVGINHLGDWGTQFGKLIVAYRKWGSREKVESGGIDTLVELYVKFHAEAEKDDSLNQAARDEFKKLEDGDPDSTALWKWFIDISNREYEITFRQLGITFDSYAGESFYTDKMPEQIERLREKNLLVVDNGASMVDLSAYNMPPCLILKSDGSTLYPTRDIAAAVYRKRTYDFDKCIYVTSAGQSLHFAQWFKVVELMGYDWYNQLVHVPYGTVSIGGEKLATRTGNVVLLKDLFAQAIDKVRGRIEEKNPGLADKDAVAEAVGVGAVVFHYLYNSRIKDINFVMEDALSFEGNTGPYAQYTYARTCSVLEKAGEIPNAAGKITAPEEAEVLKILSRFPEKVQTALGEYEPSVITRYAIDLCTAFNRFYHNCPILSAEDADVRATRLRITRASGTVIKTALRLICLRTPEKI